MRESTTPRRGATRTVIAVIAALLTGCSGGGGGDNTPAPTVQLQAEPSEVESGGTTTLTWSSTNADTCQASGGWSGTKLVSGSEAVGSVTMTTTFTLQCTGHGGTASASAIVTLLGATGTVAGNLLVPTISRSDSDVNDPLARFEPNDNDLQAQVMPNPVVIGGYLNEPGAGPDGPPQGPPGRSFAIGDLEDWYQLDLVAGQVIELVIPLAIAGVDDLDIEVYDSDLDLVGSSVSEGQFEQVTVTAGGTYFIRVFVVFGAAMYRLSVGQATDVSGGSTLRLSDDFVPGELIVTLKSAGDPAAKTAKSDAVLATRYDTSRKGGDPGREMLLKLPADTTKVVSGMTRRPGASKAATAAPGGGAAPAPRVRITAAQQRKLETLLFAKRLRADPDVRFADVNRVMRTSRVPLDPGYAIQRWHYEQIQLPGAWDVTTGGPIRVAVVDTGVASHPDLASKLELIDGRDFVSNPTNPDGDGRDANPADPGCGISGGSIFHGTHVAGTIGASSNNLTGVAGVSWGARIIPVRALDGCTGSGEDFDIIQGIRYAAGLPNDSGTVLEPSRRAAVINLSFGAKAPCDATSNELFTEVRAQGVVVVAAAGNDNANATVTPASCDHVISVAAVGPLRTRAPYSNFGALIDVAAPGGDMSRDVNGDGQPDGVYSTHASGGSANTSPTFQQLEGTSMAAPHVSGVIALMLSRDATVRPEQIDSLLEQGALTDDVSPAEPDDLGMGLINARKAVEAVGQPLPPAPPTLSVTPSSLAFGDIETSREVFVTNAGGGTLVIPPGGVTASEPWLSAAATSVDENGLRFYTLTVDRTGLSAGSYSGFVRFSPTTGDPVEVNVLMEVVDVTGEPSAGLQYVLLIDPVTNEALAQVEVQAEGTSVAYRFDGVAVGEYIVLSGTDLNNDGFICDPAEACGAYPVENAPVPIVVTDNGVVEGLDFLVTYRAGVPITASSKTTSKDVRPELRRRRIMR